MMLLKPIFESLVTNNLHLKWAANHCNQIIEPVRWTYELDHFTIQMNRYELTDSLEQLIHKFSHCYFFQKLLYDLVI